MSSGQLHHFSQHLDEPLEGCGPSIRPAWEWLIQHHVSVLPLDRYRFNSLKNKEIVTDVIILSILSFEYQHNLCAFVEK